MTIWYEWSFFRSLEGLENQHTWGRRFTFASSRFPSIFTSQFVNVVQHFLLGESDILFVTIFWAPPRWLEKVANEDLGAEAEMLPLEILDAFLFEVLKWERKKTKSLSGCKKQGLQLKDNASACWNGPLLGYQVPKSERAKGQILQWPLLHLKISSIY